MFILLLRAWHFHGIFVYKHLQFAFCPWSPRVRFTSHTKQMQNYCCQARVKECFARLEVSVLRNDGRRNYANKGNFHCLHFVTVGLAVKGTGRLCNQTNASCLPLSCLFLARMGHCFIWLARQGVIVTESFVVDIASSAGVWENLLFVVVTTSGRREWRELLSFLTLSICYLQLCDPRWGAGGARNVLGVCVL